MLLALPNNLSAAVKTSESLMEAMDIRQIYNSTLRLLNDAIKSTCGVVFDSSDYTKIVNSLRNNFGNTLFELLDYIMCKERLNDVTMFQSDILILHYKFVKGGFKFKAFEAPVEQVDRNKKRADDQNEGRDILQDKSLEPWEKDDKLRSLKIKKLQSEKNEKVPEMVSKKWGPEIKDGVPDQPEKSKLTKEQFTEIVGGAVESEKI
jgi:hypothetical protein